MTQPSRAAEFEGLNFFYSLLKELEAKVGGVRQLSTCLKRDVEGVSGVYFFFEDGEIRQGSGTGNRVVRVGTHGLKLGSKSTLWGRLSQHRGGLQGGNQRGSVFRRHVGGALQSSGQFEPVKEWFKGSSASADQRAREVAIEMEVSRVIGGMPVLWLRQEDETGPGSERGFIERNAIALLSSSVTTQADPASAAWLGHHAKAQQIRDSGLWNVRHVGDKVEAGFLNLFAKRVWEQ